MFYHCYLFLSLALLLSACSPTKRPYTQAKANHSLIDSSLNILFLGDLAWGENYQLRNEQRGRENILTTRGYGYSFQKVLPILDKAPLIIANYESTITNLANSPLKQVKNYLHKGNPLYVPNWLKKYNIQLLSLANNHALDYGHEGLLQTQHYLREAGLQYFGAGLNIAEAATPYRQTFKLNGKILNLYVLGWMEYRKSYSQQGKYAFYADSAKSGVNYWDEERILTQIRNIRRQDSAAFIVAFPHWGKNYRWRSKKQISIAHAIIAAGADVLIGHGAHKVQEIEKYRKKWICYNMGNFVFNSSGRYQKEEVKPYSIAILLEIKPEYQLGEYRLTLLPIFSDNRITNYQPRSLSKEEFLDMSHLLMNKSSFQHQEEAFISIDSSQHIIRLK